MSVKTSVKKSVRLSVKKSRSKKSLSHRSKSTDVGQKNVGQNDGQNVELILDKYRTNVGQMSAYMLIKMSVKISVNCRYNFGKVYQKFEGGWFP